MAFGPAATLVEDYEFIAPSDPALDKKNKKAFARSWKLYEERGDASVLPLLAGQEPTRWKIRHVEGRAGEVLLGLVHQAQQDASKYALCCYVACQYGLVGAENLETDKGGDFQFTMLRCPDTKAPMLADSVLSTLKRIPPYSLIYEIGARIVRALSLDPL